VTEADRPRLRVFFDTSALIAGSASRSGASYVLLQMAGLGLVDGRISAEVREEAVRNTARKLPAALPALKLLLRDALVEGEPASQALMESVEDHAEPEDRPILAAALAQECRYLVTLNERDFHPPPGLIVIVRPGDLLRRIREVIVTVDVPESGSESG
jgi:predicted nucleic acid-binding protein